MRYVIAGKDDEPPLRFRLDNGDEDMNFEVYIDNEWHRIAHVAYIGGENVVTLRPAESMPLNFRRGT